MSVEPVKKNAIAFIDGQNLFRCAKTAFGHGHPNYDVQALASAVCSLKGWQLAETRFYTGVPDVEDDPVWNHFWTAKLAQMGRQKVRAYSRALRYRNQRFRLPDGTEQIVMVAQEKGIDGIINEDRLGLDVIYVQAKRWQNTVGRKEIQSFVGALAGQQANKGVFITTSDFAQTATDYAKSVQQKAILIDGARLAELMIEHNIGVTTTRSISLKRIDSDYFEEN